MSIQTEILQEQSDQIQSQEQQIEELRTRLDQTIEQTEQFLIWLKGEI